MAPTEPLTATLRLEGAGGALTLPRATARLTSPGGRTSEAELTLGRVLIGQSGDCQLQADDPALSRVHAELVRDQDQVVLKDLGSKNGTFIDGVRVREAVLTLGQKALLGGSTLTLDAGGAPRTLPLSSRASFGGAVGQSVVMRVLFAQLERIAQGDGGLLLLGESGTGRELLARGVHDASSRRGRDFVVLDCRALSSQVVESELFGHEKGAFTGASTARQGLLESANGGTLFLDGLTELPLELQPKLLRALESGELRRVGANDARHFDARVIGAADPDLRARVRDGSFRADLYYRLAVTELTVPPLRDRREDLPLLLDHFLRELDPPQRFAQLPAPIRALLLSHHWPGNVRELRNVGARLALFPEVSPEVLRLDPAPPQHGVFRGLPLAVARDAAVERFEREYLQAALEASGGVMQRTAKALGISRQYLHKLLTAHGLSSRDE